MLTPLYSRRYSYAFMTYPFVHANLIHLALNLIALILVGPRFEQAYGPYQLWITFLVGAWLPGFIRMVIDLLKAPERVSTTLCMGASAGVFALFSALAMSRSHPESADFAWTFLKWEFLALGVLVWFRAYREKVWVMAHVIGLIVGVCTVIEDLKQYNRAHPELHLFYQLDGATDRLSRKKMEFGFKQAYLAKQALLSQNSTSQISQTTTSQLTLGGQPSQRKEEAVWKITQEPY